jgi:hypothetical protein
MFGFLKQILGASEQAPEPQAPSPKSTAEPLALRPAPTPKPEPEPLSVEWFAKAAEAAWQLEYRRDEAGQREYEAKLVAVLRWNSKDEYLAWVAGWKAAYAEMTRDARHPVIEERPYRYLAKRNGEYVKEGGEYVWVDAILKRKKTRWHGGTRRLMLVFRKEGKIRSWAQRNARLEKDAVADEGASRRPAGEESGR